MNPVDDTLGFVADPTPAPNLGFVPDAEDFGFTPDKPASPDIVAVDPSKVVPPNNAWARFDVRNTPKVIADATPEGVKRLLGGVATAGKAAGEMMGYAGNVARAVPADVAATVAGDKAAQGNIITALKQPLVGSDIAPPRVTKGRVTMDANGVVSPLPDVTAAGQPPARALPIDTAIEQAGEQEKLQGARPVATTLANISQGLARTAPKIAALPLAGESLLAQSFAAGGLFGLDDNGNFSAKDAVLMAAMPGVSAVARAATGAALGAAISSGAKALENPMAQKVIETLGDQAGLNAYMLATSSPELVKLYQTDKPAFQREFASIVGQNLAFGLLGVRHLGSDVPSATRQFIERNAQDFSQKTLANLATDELSRQLDNRPSLAVTPPTLAAQPDTGQTAEFYQQRFSGDRTASPAAGAEMASGGSAPSAPQQPTSQIPDTSAAEPEAPAAADASKPLTRQDLLDAVKQITDAVQGNRLTPGPETPGPANSLESGAAKFPQNKVLQTMAEISRPAPPPLPEAGTEPTELDKSVGFVPDETEGPDLTGAAESATKEAVAPGTDTVGTALTGTQEQRGSTGTAPGDAAITAERGLNPRRSATKANRRGPGLTEADGDLFSLTQDFGRIPAFIPDGIVKAQYLRLKKKFANGAGFLSPKERELYARLKDVFPPNYEDDYGVGGEKMRAAYDAAKKAGIANEVFGRTKSASAGALHEHLDFMAKLKGRDYSTDDLWDMVTRHSNEYAERNSGRAAAKEDAHWETVQQQDEAFKRDVNKPTKGTQSVPVEHLAEGDYFKLKGARFRVENITFDETGAVQRIDLEDGSKYGHQRIERDESGNIALRMDKGSLRSDLDKSVGFVADERKAVPETGTSAVPKLRTGEKGTGDLLQGQDAPFNLSGESGVDAERIAREKAEAEQRKKEADELASKQQPGLPGTEPPRDKIKDLLDKAIAATDPLGELKRGELMGGAALPKWATKTLLNGALKVIRAAYQGGKHLKAAIEDGLAWLRAQNVKGFDEQEARDWLTQKATQANPVIQRTPKAAGEANLGPNVHQSYWGNAPIHPDDRAELDRLEDRRKELTKVAEATGDYAALQAINTEMDRLLNKAQPRAKSIPDIQARLAEIDQRLGEIAGEGATKRKTFENVPMELRSERYALSKEARDLQRELNTRPEYVRDLLLRADDLGKRFKAARAAGKDAVSRELGEELQSIHEGELAQVPPDVLNRVMDELTQQGKLSPSTLRDLHDGRTLANLTEWLQSNKVDSPGLTLRQRFDVARKLADRWQNAKDALGKMGDRVGAAWEAFKTQYQAPKVDTEFRSLLKDWFFAKQWTGLETHNWVEAIRQAVPQVDRRAAMSIWLDAGGDENLLRAQGAEVPERYKNVWQTALTLTSKEKALVRRIGQDFEEKLAAGMNSGLIEKGRFNYGVPQVWKVEPKHGGDWDPFAKKQTARNPLAKLDPRAPFFSLHRTHSTYFDGIMAGGIPKGLDIGDLVGLYNADMHNSLADRAVVKSLKDAKAADGKPLVMIPGSATVLPRGDGERTYFVDPNWRPKDAVTADGRPYRTIDHWALRDWKFASTTEDGNPILVRGDFLVHPDAYAALKNELGTSWLRDPEGGGKYFNWALNSVAFLKASKFASATFHMATLAEHSMFHAVSGKPTLDRLSLLWPVTRGVELDPSKNAELAGLLQHGTELGFNGQRELFEEGLSSHGGIWAQVPGLGDALGRVSDFMFKRYMPALKVKTGLTILHANQARYKGKLSEQQIYELSSNQANAAFGAQNWRLLGTNKTMLDVNRLFLTAPDFLLSRAKVVGQALKPYNAEQRYFIMAQAALVYTAARALNQLLDGDPHWEPDNMDRVIYKGRAYRARFLVSDIMALLKDSPTFVAGRLGPLVRSGIETTTGRDMRTGARKDTYFKEPFLRWAEIFVKDMASWLTPVGVEGLLPGATGREQTGPGQMALSLLGVGSGKYSAQTQMWQQAADFNRNSADKSAQLYQETRDKEAKSESAYRKLDDLLDAGESKAAQKEYNALVADGHKPASIESRYEAVNRPFTGNGTRERDFRAGLTPHMQEVYRDAIDERQARLEQFRKLAR